MRVAKSCMAVASAIMISLAFSTVIHAAGDKHAKKVKPVPNDKFLDGLCVVFENLDIEGYTKQHHPKYFNYLKNTKGESGEFLLEIGKGHAVEYVFTPLSLVSKPYSCSHRTLDLECVPRNQKKNEGIGLNVDGCNIVEIEITGPDNRGKKIWLASLLIGGAWYLGDDVEPEGVTDTITIPSTALFRSMDKAGDRLCKAFVLKDGKEILNAYLSPAMLSEFAKKGHEEDLASWKRAAANTAAHVKEEKVTGCKVARKSKGECDEIIKEYVRRNGAEASQCGDITLTFTRQGQDATDMLFSVYESQGEWYLTSEMVGEGPDEERTINKKQINKKMIGDVGERICAAFKSGDIDALMSVYHPGIIDYLRKNMLIDDDKWNKMISTLKEEASSSEQVTRCDVYDASELGCPNDFIELAASAGIDVDSCGVAWYEIVAGDYEGKDRASSFLSKGKWYWADISLIITRFVTKVEGSK